MIVKLVRFHSEVAGERVYAQDIGCHGGERFKKQLWHFVTATNSRSHMTRRYSGRGRGLCSALCWTVLARRSDAVPNRFLIVSAT